MARVHRIDGVAPEPLTEGWRLIASAPNAWARPSDVSTDAKTIPARVPGTVAAALRDQGRFDPADPEELDDRDWWFTTAIEGRGRKTLRFEGLATIADIYVDDARVAQSTGMFDPVEVDIDLAGSARVSICCRALSPLLAQPGRRARWRTKAAAPQTLRFYRTTLLGRMNGWCPPVHAVGPWRGVSMREAAPRVVEADLKPRCEGGRGVLTARFRLKGLDAGSATLRCGEHEASLARTGDGAFAGELVIEDVRRWSPHTHGDPRLYDVSVKVRSRLFDCGRVGFRDVVVDREADGEGFALVVNGARVFCRGALWTTPDLVSLAGDCAACEPLLRRMRDAGMNMVRVGGTTVYESDAFYSACDELGLLVWQDFMFSNFDYPVDDPAFAALVDREARAFLDRTQNSPSIVVVCGASEVAQQAAMLGLPAKAWTNALFEETLRDAATALRPDAIYLAQTPFGGSLPFEPARGVCHYYGVSAYRRPIEDAREARVRFAAECLGFANPPEGPVAIEPDRAAIVQPCWGKCYERDVGATWFFEEVRNHYLASLYGVDPEALRREDADRYLAFSRAVGAELMESVFALWRRAGSPTAGGLVWFLRDVVEGAGFGLLDARNRPKSVWWALRRAFRPLQVLLIDEGLNGLHAHLVNERAVAIEATLSLVCLREGATPVMRAERALRLAPGSTVAIPAADLWGGFFDTGYAYRFGPPSHSATVARLTDAKGETIAEAFHFPLGRGAALDDSALHARLEATGEHYSLILTCDRLAQSVHLDDASFEPDDNWFHLAPGVERRLRLTPSQPGAKPRGAVRALNAPTICYGEPS